MRLRKLLQTAGAVLVLTLGVACAPSASPEVSPAATPDTSIDTPPEPADPTEGPGEDPTDNPHGGQLSDPVTGTSVEDEFVGRWLWEGDTVTVLEFYADGSGNSFWGTFSWTIVGDEIQWDMDAVNEVWRWAFTFDGNDLTITSRQVEGMEYTYFRTSAHNGAARFTDRPEGDDSASVSSDQLVGLWLWDIDGHTELVFHADGRGDGYMGPFEWVLLPGNELQWHLLDQSGSPTTRWEVSVDGDVLNIASLQAMGTTWTYLRAASQ